MITIVVVGDAFLLPFPFGHTGIPTDPAVMEVKEKSIQNQDKNF
jgi:hypothetical protein